MFLRPHSEFYITAGGHGGGVSRKCARPGLKEAGSRHSAQILSDLACPLACPHVMADMWTISRNTKLTKA